MVVSQFTLMAATKKGNRPSYIRAAKHEQAIPLYELFVQKAQESLSSKVVTGTFGADMQVELANDGPITIWIDSKNREQDFLEDVHFDFQLNPKILKYLLLDLLGEV